MHTPASFDVVSAAEPDGKKLIRSLEGTGCTALLGSRISSWKPSGLPAGEDVTGSLARLLSRPLVNARTIEALIGRTAFEHAMQACPEDAKDTLADNLVRLYGQTVPNPVHQAVAALIEIGVVRHVVTTNYDDGIEQACAQHGGSRTSAVQVVVYPGSTVDLDRPVIFKIHGCAVGDSRRLAGVERSAVFCLAQEGLLRGWKRDLLASLLADTSLFVCGYSGLDFEICPEIHALGTQIERVVWNSFKDPRALGTALTPNARRVLSHTRGVALVGDMRKILSELVRPGLAGLASATGSPPRDVTGDLVDGLSEWHLNAWRLSLFSSIGCATEGVRLAQEMTLDAGPDPRRRWTGLHGMGQALFHQGSYECSAGWYLRAAKVARDNGLEAEEFRAEMDAAEAERAGGRWIRAWRRRERAKAFHPGPTHFGVYLRRALLAKRPYKMARSLHLVPKQLRTSLETMLRAAAKGAVESGAWLDYQQCISIAEELGLDRDLVFAGLARPLESQAGYRHLGYFVAECHSIRKVIDEGHEVPDVSELVWRLDRLWELGAGAESYKFAAAIERLHGKGTLSRVQQRRAAEMRRRCEYRPWVRALMGLGLRV
jgi:hypothetical protein